jgi:hypothetical protein
VKQSRFIYLLYRYPKGESKAFLMPFNGFLNGIVTRLRLPTSGQIHFRQIIGPTLKHPREAPIVPQ